MSAPATAISDPPPWDMPGAVARTSPETAVALPAAGPGRASAPPAPPTPRPASGGVPPPAAEALDRGIVMAPSAATAPSFPPQPAASDHVPAPAAEAPAVAVAPLSDAATIADAEDWLRRVAGCDLKGPARELAAHTAFMGHADGVLTLALAPGFEYLRTERSVAVLAQALAASLGAEPRIAIQTGQLPPAETLNERRDRERDSRQSAAEATFLNDPGVRRLIEQHGARVVPDSIRPFDE
jgi:DNA polymerase-3 subunit gamma/tau